METSANDHVTAVCKIMSTTPPAPERRSQGLSVLATFNACSGDRQRIEEAVELWDEARTTTKPRVDLPTEEKGESNDANASLGDTMITGEDNAAAIAQARASVLRSAAQGELLLERGTEKALEYLQEALDSQKEVLPTGHPATVSWPVHSAFVAKP